MAGAGGAIIASEESIGRKTIVVQGEEGGGDEVGKLVPTSTGGVITTNPAKRSITRIEKKRTNITSTVLLDALPSSPRGVALSSSALNDVGCSGLSDAKDQLCNFNRVYYVDTEGIWFFDMDEADDEEEDCDADADADTDAADPEKTCKNQNQPQSQSKPTPQLIYQSQNLHSIKVDGRGNLWVAAGSSGVLVIDSTTKEKIGSFGLADNDAPIVALALNGDGWVYFATELEVFRTSVGKSVSEIVIIARKS